jgi:hypothetical protein
MANRVWATIVSTPDFGWIMDYFPDFYKREREISETCLDTIVLTGLQAPVDFEALHLSFRLPESFV